MGTNVKEKIQPRGYARFGNNLGEQLESAFEPFGREGTMMFQEEALLRVPRFNFAPVRTVPESAEVVAEIKRRAKKILQDLKAIRILKKLVRERKDRIHADIYAV